MQHDVRHVARFNRTFMELKGAWCPGARRGPPVSIAPLWNWKLMACVLPMMTMPFQSHLYGIESCVPSPKHRSRHAFQSHLYGIESCNALGKYGRLLRFNRTFMELKEHGNRVARLDTLVSIAPLWNWKCSIKLNKPRKLNSFNRTFMELKAWISK